MQPITALVLCGGLGTRLRPLVGDLPKALAPVAGRPFIDHLLDYLRRQGVTDVVLCTGFGAEQVATHCGDGSAWDVRLRYSPEPCPLGTGGAVRHAQQYITGPFLVLNGDSLVRVDLTRLLAHHLDKGARITLALIEVADRLRFGSVTL